MINLTTTLILLLALLASPLQAQEWIERSSTTEGDIFDLASMESVVPGQNIVIGAVWIFPGSAAIVRSSNGGETWTTTFNDVNMGLTGAARLGPTAAVVTGGTNALVRAYRSTDAGNGWTKTFETSTGAPALWCVDATSNGLVLGGGGNGVIARSENGGVSWSIMTTIAGAGDIIDMEVVDTDLAFAVAADGANYLSGEKLFRSTDGGYTWEETGNFSTIRAVRMSTRTEGIAVGSTFQGSAIWSTTDGGSTWRRVYQHTNASMQFEDAAYDPVNPLVITAVGGDVYTAGGRGLIVRSTNGGATWSPMAENVPSALLAVACPTPTRSVVVGMSGYVATHDHQAVPPPTRKLSISLDAELPDTVLVGSAEIGRLLITTATAAPVRIDSVALSMNPKGSWSVAASVPLPTVLREGEELMIFLGYSPSVAGDDSVMVSIFSNDEENARRNIAFASTAVSPPSLRVFETEVDFGTIDIGDSAKAQIHMVAMNETPVRIDSITMFFQNSNGTIERSTSSTLPHSLTEQEELVATLTWRPTLFTELRGTISIHSNDAEQPVRMLMMRGVGREPVSVLEDDIEAGPRIVTVYDLQGRRIGRVESQDPHAWHVLTSLGRGPFIIVTQTRTGAWISTRLLSHP